MNWVCSIPPCRVRVTSRTGAAATVSRPPHRTVHHMVVVVVAILLLLPPRVQLQHRMVCSMAAFPHPQVMATRQAPHQASISISSTSSISIICRHIARRRSYTMAMNPTRMDALAPSTSAWASPRRAPSWTRVPVSLQMKLLYIYALLPAMANNGTLEFTPSSCGMPYPLPNPFP